MCKCILVEEDVQEVLFDTVRHQTWQTFNLSVTGNDRMKPGTEVAKLLKSKFWLKSAIGPLGWLRIWFKSKLRLKYFWVNSSHEHFNLNPRFWTPIQCQIYSLNHTHAHEERESTADIVRASLKQCLHYCLSLFYHAHGTCRVSTQRITNWSGKECRTLSMMDKTDWSWWLSILVVRGWADPGCWTLHITSPSSSSRYDSFAEDTISVLVERRLHNLCCNTNVKTAV